MEHTRKATCQKGLVTDSVCTRTNETMQREKREKQVGQEKRQKREKRTESAKKAYWQKKGQSREWESTLHTRTNKTMQRDVDCQREGEEAERVEGARARVEQQKPKRREQKVLKECASEKGHSREQERLVHTGMNYIFERVVDWRKKGERSGEQVIWVSEWGA